MDRLVRRAMLFDYYGELLNEKQRSVISGAVSEDLSLSEIGEKEGISRQAVSETLKRIDERFEKYEETLGLMERSERVRKHLEEIREIAGKLDQKDRRRLLFLTEKISEEL